MVEWKVREAGSRDAFSPPAMHVLEPATQAALSLGHDAVGAEPISRCGASPISLTTPYDIPGSPHSIRLTRVRSLTRYVGFDCSGMKLATVQEEAIQLSALLHYDAQRNPAGL